MKTKRLFALFLVLVFISTSNVFANSAPSLNVNAKAAILMEPTTGKILLEQNAHEKLPLASVTKVMTMLLIYESVAQGKIAWDDVVTISDHAAGMGGSQVFLEAMEQQTVRELTKCIVVSSANDAAVAMAEFIAGSEEGFVIMMNERAKSLGMNDTNFLNACGLDVDGHVSSAYDIALMSKELINNHPEVYDFTKIWMDTIVHKTARGNEEFGLSNTNRLIRSYSGATGLKTGSTSEALYCISATAMRGDMNLIAVVLGAPDPNTRFHEAMKMLDFGFASYAIIKGDEKGTNVGTIKVIKGEKQEVPVVVKNQINCLVPKNNTSGLESQIEILSSLIAPVVSGAKAGEIVYYFEGTEVGRSDLVALEEIQKASLGDIISRLLYDWFKY